MKIKNKKRIFKIITLNFFLFFLCVSISQATEINFVPQVGIPNTEFNTTVTFKGDSGTYYIAKFVQAIYEYGVSVVAILAAIMLMAGGLVWLSSGGNQEKVDKAKNIIFGSLIGLSILLGGHTILKVINPNLVNLRIKTIDTIETYGCCDLGSDGMMSSLTNCYNNLVSIHGNKSEKQSKTDYVKDYFWENKIWDNHKNACVQPECCQFNIKRIELQATYQLVDSCNGFEAYSYLFPLYVESVKKVDMSYCKETLQLCPIEEMGNWGHACNNVGNSVPCFCFNGEPHFESAERNEFCGKVANARCEEGNMFKWCPDNMKHSGYSGRYCKLGLYCCYKD